MPSPAGRLTRALQHRNFRLFFGGQSISLVGTWITRVATSWLVYRLTGSELLLGVAGFAGQIPTLIITPFAGVLVDRHDRRRILLITQVASLLQSALLAALTFTNVNPNGATAATLTLYIMSHVQSIDYRLNNTAWHTWSFPFQTTINNLTRRPPTMRPCSTSFTKSGSPGAGSEASAMTRVSPRA